MARPLVVACCALALSVAAVVLLVFLGLSLRKTSLRKAVLRQGARSVPELGGAGLLPRSGPQLQAWQISSQNDVVPLVWDPSHGVYLVRLQVGKSWVKAAVDTGSARLVVSTTDAGGLYDPSGAVQLMDPRTQGPCTSTIAYVSQSETVQAVQDSIAFPRITVDPRLLCTEPVEAVLAAAAPAKQLQITQFPVAAATTPGSSLNVFGLSGVVSDTRTPAPQGGKDLYVLPSCQTSDVPAFESAFLESICGFHKAKGDTCAWSLFLGASSGFLSVGRLLTACMQPQYTPLVPSLPNASSALGRTPSRYYVVAVVACAVGKIGQDVSTYVPLAGFPKFMLVDTGTTQVLLPGAKGPANATALGALGPQDMAVLVLANSVTLTFKQADVTYGGTKSPVFSSMSASTAQNFSTTLDTGILGCTGLRGLYLEFDLGAQRLGLAQP